MTRMRQHAGASKATGLIVLAIAVAAALTWVTAGSGAARDVGWAGFVNTPDSTRADWVRLNPIACPEPLP